MLSQFNRFYNIRGKLNKLPDHTIDHFVLFIVLHMHNQTKQFVKCTICFLNWFLDETRGPWATSLTRKTVEIGYVVLEKFFKFRQFICYFVLYLSLKKAWTFIWTYLNSLNPEMLCTKFSLGYWVLRRIFLFRLYVLLLRCCGDLHLNKVPRDVLC